MTNEMPLYITALMVVARKDVLRGNEGVLGSKGMGKIGWEAAQGRCTLNARFHQKRALAGRQKP